MEEGKKKGKAPSASFLTGAVALIFLIIGYEVAVFVHKAAVTRIESNRDHPDTVYVYVPSGSGAGSGAGEHLPLRNKKADAPGRVSTDSGAVVTVRRNAPHSPVVAAVRAATRRVETFRFNPNTVSVEDLQRLGFSEKQALSIDNYRSKGGRFRRPSDFAKSYVVADSVYARLEPFIDIPKLDINTADSTALLDLPGVGPYFAGKIVSYRRQLGGYSCKEQLMEIYHFDRGKYDRLSDLIICSPSEPFALWTLPEASLAAHPHISRSEAHGIVLYRSHHAPSECTLDALHRAGVLSDDHFSRLSFCRIAPL